MRENYYNCQNSHDTVRCGTQSQSHIFVMSRIVEWLGRGTHNHVDQVQVLGQESGGLGCVPPYIYVYKLIIWNVKVWHKLIVFGLQLWGSSNNQVRDIGHMQHINILYFAYYIGYIYCIQDDHQLIKQNALL